MNRKDIRMLNCEDQVEMDLCVNHGWALQRKLDGEWVTIAWFRSAHDIREMVKEFGQYGQQN